MPSMYGKSFSEKSRIWEGEKAKRDLVKANQRIAELESTWVPDELLEKLIVFMLDTGDFTGSEDKTYEEARAILDKRREAR